MKNLTREDIHDELKKMFADLVKVLDENGIEYFVAWGTCLGTIRHQGFIPWDDDIDIFVLRKDFEKLHSIKWEEPYFLTDGEKGTSHYPFIKFSNRNIEVEENLILNEKYRKINLYIDVFALDYAPNDEKKRKKILKRQYFLIRKLNAFTTVGYSKIANMIKWFLRTFFKNYDVTKIVKQITSMGEKEKTDYFIDSWGRKDFKAEWFDGYEIKSFEGIQVKAPKGWDEFLTCLYGDYMTLPPEKDRVHHDMIAYYIDK